MNTATQPKPMSYAQELKRLIFRKRLAEVGGTALIISSLISGVWIGSYAGSFGDKAWWVTPVQFTCAVLTVSLVILGIGFICSANTVEHHIENLQMKIQQEQD